ncbi:MAG: DUF998 domain-containing protein [Candidatus Bathyarchaeia archaeon]
MGVLRFSGLSGIAAVALGFSAVLLSIASSPWFNWTENALSDLGVGGSGLIFNTGLIASGVLLIFFFLGLLKLSGGCWAWKLGSYMFLADAISLVGVGVFNESFGRVHLYFSLVFFILMPLSLIMLGLSLWSRGIRGLSLFTLFLALVTPTVWLMPWRGAAIPEALSTLATAVWMINISLKMLRSETMDRLASCPSGRVSRP